MRFNRLKDNINTVLVFSVVLVTIFKGNLDFLDFLLIMYFIPFTGICGFPITRTLNKCVSHGNFISGWFYGFLAIFTNTSYHLKSPSKQKACDCTL